VVEGRQPLDPILQVQLVPLADRVVIEKQYFADRRAAQAIVQQNKRVGAAGEPMRGGAVAGQVDQVAAGFAVKEAGTDPAVLNASESHFRRLHSSQRPAVMVSLKCNSP